MVKQRETLLGWASRLHECAKPSYLGLACVVAGLLVGPGHCCWAKDWPQWRGPHRDGISRETKLNSDWQAKPPRLLWTATGMGAGYASVAVVGNQIFSTGNLEQGQAVVAVDVQEGRIQWTSQATKAVPRHGYPGSRSTPAVDGDRLYAVMSDGTIACLRRSNGEVVWRRQFQADWNGQMMSVWGYAESPLVDDGRVICTPGGSAAMMVALDKQTGAEVWATRMPNYPDENGSNGQPLHDGAGYSSVVISHAGGVKQYIQLIGRGVIGVRASDGKLLWRYRDVANATANIPTPVVHNDFVFCSTGYQTGSALLRLVADGEQVKAQEIYRLEGKALQNHHGGSVLLDGYLYLGNGHNKGFPTCVEWKTGKRMWGGRMRGPGSGSAAVAAYDGHLIFRYQSGEVALIEATPEAYRLKGSFRPDYVQGPSWAHPVVSGGRLFLREQDKLMCYDLR